MLVNTEKIYMPSIFDDENISNFTIWRKNANTFKKFSNTHLMEGILFKQSKRTNFWKSRYYVLFEDRLAYYKVNIIYHTRYINFFY